MSDLFNKLANSAKQPEKKQNKSKSKDRPKIALTEEAKNLFKMFIPAKVLKDHFDSHYKNTREQLNDIAFKLWVKTLWNTKSQPTNPKITMERNGKPDLESLLVVTTNFKVQVPEGDDPAREIRLLLNDNGVDLTLASKLVNNELDFTPILQMRPLNHLQYGKYENGDFISSTKEEKAVAEKIMALVSGEKTDPLTEEEKSLAFELIQNVKVKPGFLNRVCNYARKEDHLHAIFRVIKPTIQNRGAKYGISDSLVEREERLIGEASEILEGISDAD